MFSLEVDFRDGVSPAEIIFVRRPHAIIGSSEFAHVVLESSGQGLQEVRISRGLGREFRCQPLRKLGERGTKTRFIEGVYNQEASLDLGGVTARITALDLDLQVRSGESPDAAGVRVLRRAMTSPAPVFPAVAVHGAVPIFVSFSEPLLIGRSRNCGLRLDAPDVSSEHARISFEDGEFWVEDLGSSNGTYVQSARISGKRKLDPQEQCTLGSEIAISVLTSLDDVAHLTFPTEDVPPVPRAAYPSVVATSELVKPSRYTFTTSGKVTIGRDPASDIWVAAAHISRVHAEIRLLSDGQIEVCDMSSNGTFLQGQRLPKEEPIQLAPGLIILDLNSGLNLAICCSADDEKAYLGGSTAGPGFNPENFLPNKERTASLDRDELEKTPEAGDRTPASFIEEQPSGFERLAQGGFVPPPEPRFREFGTMPREEERYDAPLEEEQPEMGRVGRGAFVTAVLILVTLLVVLLVSDFG